MAVCLFQSTLPQGERPFCLFLPDCPYLDFNPRSRKGSDLFVLLPYSRRTYFNPRSRKGSDLRDANKITKRVPISIHAPARGATRYSLIYYACSSISIHAPARGATWEQFKADVATAIFQSTLPQGERLFCAAGGPVDNKISIHAPARGATGMEPISVYLTQFQSTLPQGERQSGCGVPGARQ